MTKKSVGQLALHKEKKKKQEKKETKKTKAKMGSTPYFTRFAG